MAKVVRVHFATNRKRDTGPEIFGTTFQDDKHPEKYVTGSIDVLQTDPNLPDSGWQAAENTLVIDDPPVSDSSTHRLVQFAKDRAPGSSQQLADDYGLVFLHGFATRFRDSMARAAQIADAYNAKDVFCFSWPANGVIDLPNYTSDQDDARRSAPAIAHALTQLFAYLYQLKAKELPRLNIVAHSMGNFALSNALQIIRKREKKLLTRTIFDGAILTAADERHDALSRPDTMESLPKLCRRTTVYINGGDLALTLSQAVNLKSRLGHFGPMNLASFPKSKNVTMVDCSDVSNTQGDLGMSHFGHQYFRASAWVIRDSIQVLQNRAPEDIYGRLPSLADPMDGRAWWIPYDTDAGYEEHKRRYRKPPKTPKPVTAKNGEKAVKTISQHRNGR